MLFGYIWGRGRWAREVDGGEVGRVEGGKRWKGGIGQELRSSLLFFEKNKRGVGTDWERVPR